MGLIPPTYLDAVVAIGSGKSTHKISWNASGFLYGYHDPLPKEPNRYVFFIITNRHVFEGLKVAWLRFNPKKVDQPARPFQLDLLKKGEPRWLSHQNKDIDVAVMPINIRILREQGMEFGHFLSNQHVANVKQLNKLGIMEGDFAYVLGFPMGIVGERRSAVIVRRAAIARIRDVLEGSSNEFIIDAFVFPGNSGGPVVSKPEAISIQGTKSQNASYLIGLVKSYIPYHDIAISQQTKRPRVIFEENSGLAAVHPVDSFQEIVSNAVKRVKSTGELKK